MRIKAAGLAVAIACIMPLASPAHAGNGMSMGDMDMSSVNMIASVSILDISLIQVANDTNRWMFVLPIDRIVHDGEEMVLYPVMIAEDGTVYSHCAGVTPVITLADDGVAAVCIDIDVAAVPHTVGLVDENGMLICSADIKETFGGVLDVRVAVYNRAAGQLLFVFDDAVESMDTTFITVRTQDGTEVPLDGASGMYTDNVAWYQLDVDADALYVDVQANGVLCDAVFLGTYNIPVIIV